MAGCGGKERFANCHCRVALKLCVWLILELKLLHT